MIETAQRALWDDGYAVVPGVLTELQAQALREAYDDDDAYRKTIDMERHNFGRGEYRYYRYPLPDLVQDLRARWYSALAPLANAWNETTRVAERYPDTLEAYLDACRRHDQVRPTPLILRYGAGDYNCMHQDVYGALGFPFQITVPLSRRDEHFTGGHTVLTEQAPRLQARPTVLQPDLGEALIFPNRYRPRKNAADRWVRFNVRHGVAPLLSGERYALGLIFHDAL